MNTKAKTIINNTFFIIPLYFLSSRKGKDNFQDSKEKPDKTCKSEVRLMKAAPLSNSYC